MKWPVWMVSTLMLALVAWPRSAVALRTGDDAAELKVDFLSNGPVSLVPAKVDANRENQLKVLVILRADSAVGAGLLPSLYDLQYRFPNVEMVVLCPDTEEATKAFFATFPNPNFATALDRTRQTTAQYMAGSAIFPKAFVIDYRGRIIWDGEAVDLGEMLESFAAGTYDESRQRKISPALEELQSRMRSGEDRMAEYAVQRVLELDPANAAALRMRLFMLENTDRAEQAWQLLERQLKAAPKERKLYLMQLDFASRQRRYGERIPEIVAAYMKNVPSDPAGDGAVGWLLLTRYPFDAAALRDAGLLVERIAAGRQGRTETLADADAWNLAALYAARIGQLDRALECQRRGTALLEKFAPHRASASKAFEEYYAAAGKAGREKKP